MLLRDNKKYLETPINHLLSIMDENPDVTRWDAYYALKPNEAMYIDSVKEGLSSQIIC
ncbi:unnamed protein product [marine sediment metagenome]|uniref:Uncharacterized protein n=1 Tax=marine sediment metagenome TaxID=412755 RepID=X0ZDB0_9ZZZZ